MPLDITTLSIISLITYFLILVLISRITSKGHDDHNSFFTGNRQSPWFVVAFGMIGTTLSGVTFISVPGWVGDTQFSYFQMVLGYIVGYTIIATVLMPLYYRLNLTSIYSYFHTRFGITSYKTGSLFFLISRTIGAAFRLYLIAIVFQVFIFDAFDIPFTLSVFITLFLIWVYTFRGGIKTIVWTDTLQTLFMLLALFISIFFIAGELNWSPGELVSNIDKSDYSRIFFFTQWRDPHFFWKDFLSGTFIAIVMTGMDQDMMQKNLSCKNIGDAQKNMFSFTAVLVVVKFIFLVLGALLYLYALEIGFAIPEKTDYLYPTLAVEHFPLYAGIFFILGLTAAAYSSADSALTALTTAFCVDFLGFNENTIGKKKSTRYLVHFGFSILIFTVIIFFHNLNDKSVISKIFQFAGYTYGPLLGMFSFGILMKRWNPIDKLVLPIAILSPVITYVISEFSDVLFYGYKFGFEVLILNGLLTFLMLWIISRKSGPVPVNPAT